MSNNIQPDLICEGGNETIIIPCATPLKTARLIENNGTLRLGIISSYFQY
ncbi:hypothetical protein RCH20_000608 [Psychrobacter sp. PL15]|nr:hypothetical protein [Psychrobacter sp. PL15]